MFRNLWNDETGAVVCIEYVLIGTICGIGVIAGLTSLRDGVVTELADLGGAVGWLNQTYFIGGISSHCSSTAGTNCPDYFDFCDTGANGNFQNSRCLAVCVGTVDVAGQTNETGATP